MESKRQTESVLAKLMGLERPLPSKLLQNGRQRVLSESYLQDIALICQQQKWSFDRFSMDADVKMLERRDSSQDLQSSSSSEEFLERYRTEEDNLFQKLWLLNSFQDSGKKVKSPKKMQSVLQNEKKTGNTEMFSDMRKKGNCLGKRERDCVRGREALRYGSTATNGIAKQIANELQNSVWHDLLNVVARPDEKIGNSNVEHVQCISNSTSFTSSGSSKCRNKNFNVHKDWCLNLVSEGSSYCKSSQKANCKSEEDTTPTNSTVIKSLNSEKDVSCEEAPSPINDLSEFGETRSPKEISTCSDVESLSSKNKDYVNVDDISEEVIDDVFMPLHQADNGSPLYQMEAYKPNPDSASNMKDISSAAHFIANHGSEAKLQHSTSTISYPEAKRHKSIDVKDAEEGGSNNHREETIPGIYKTEETQILSYLIDILAESGLQCGNLETCFELGQQPSENPINPFVFNSLEKKYSKQPSWLKSDRKLLFDRIKCALADILHPKTWRKYNTNRLLFHCNQDIIREELLSVLVNQEKEAKRVSSDKVVGIDCNWLELEEDIQIAVKEIEENLIDELMEEIVSTE